MAEHMPKTYLVTVSHIDTVFKLAAEKMNFQPETHQELLLIVANKCSDKKQPDTQPLSLLDSNIDDIINNDKKPNILHQDLKWKKDKEHRRFAYIISCEAPKGTRRSVIATAHDQILNFKKDIRVLENKIKTSACLKAVEGYGNIEDFLKRLNGSNKHKKFDDMLTNIHLATAVVYIFIKAVEQTKAELISFCTCDLPTVIHWDMSQESTDKINIIMCQESDIIATSMAGVCGTND